MSEARLEQVDSRMSNQGGANSGGEQDPRTQNLIPIVSNGEFLTREEEERQEYLTEI
jgi:hypothetical protein